MKKSEIKQLIIGVLVFALICIGTSCSAQVKSDTLPNYIISGIKFHLKLADNVQPKFKYELKAKILPINFETIFYLNSGEEFVIHKDHHYIFNLSYPGYNTIHIEIITDGMNSSRMIESTLTFHKNNTIVNDGVIIFDPTLQKFIIHP
jgi:hypothetical protein